MPYITMLYSGGKSIIIILVHVCFDNTKTTTPTNEAYIICWWDKINVHN